MPADLYFEDAGRAGAEVLARGDRLAGGLRRLGLAEGDVYAVLLRNDPVFGDIVHASRRSGCYFCPINWHSTPAEIAYLLQDSGARALIVQADLLAACASAIPAGLPLLVVGDTVPEGAIAYEAWLAQQAPYDGPQVAPRGHMAYTSGTTGRPKGVLRVPVPLAELAAQQARVQAVVRATFGIAPGCRGLVPAPLYHSAPSLFLQNALLLGERLVVTRKFDAEQVLALVERHRIDVLYLVPIMYVRLLKLPAETRAKYDLSSLRFVASTGAPCAPEVKRAMIEWLGPIIHETYASSEAGMVTCIDAHEALQRPGSAGRPVGDAQLRILHEDGTPCAPREVGLIHVRQPAYPDFTYRGNEAARRAIERDGLISLGDMGYVDEDGYLFVCDRASDMVISGGVNIYPAEIEHELLRFPGVADCAVFGVPDEEYGERLVAYVQPEPAASLQDELLMAFLKQRLSAFKVPRTIELRRELPRDDNGKIAKRRLREPYWAGRERRV
jgi:long-chain acyl-CoA synthetase